MNWTLASVKTSIEFTRAPMNIRIKRKTARRWRPQLDLNGAPTQYHQKMDKCLAESSNASLKELQSIIRDSASSFGISHDRPDGSIRPEKSVELRALIKERRRCRQQNECRELSKKILRMTRREIRL